jgi:hypothetical protein
MAPDDLIAEAYIRAAATTRNWPAGISVVRFMAEAMRSIASGGRESVKAEIRGKPAASRSNRAVDAEAEYVTDRNGVVVDFVHPPPSPEQDLLLSVFDDDFSAQLVVEGMMDGLRGKDLQLLTGLNNLEFATKYKKVSRRIDALTAERRKS